MRSVFHENAVPHIHFWFSKKKFFLGIKSTNGLQKRKLFHKEKSNWYPYVGSISKIDKVRHCLGRTSVACCMGFWGLVPKKLALNELLFTVYRRVIGSRGWNWAKIAQKCRKLAEIGGNVKILVTVTFMGISLAETPRCHHRQAS